LRFSSRTKYRFPTFRAFKRPVRIYFRSVRIPIPNLSLNSGRVPTDGARVVLESDDTVHRIDIERLLDEGNQVLGVLFVADNEPSLEEPVPGMLAVRLGDVEAVHVGGIAPQLLGEQARVVVYADKCRG